MIKIDDFEYEPIFYAWSGGKSPSRIKIKRKWYIRIGKYSAVGKTKKVAYEKLKKQLSGKGKEDEI